MNTKSNHACENPPGRDVITTRADVRRKHMIYASTIDLSPVGTSSIPSKNRTSRRSIIACTWRVDRMKQTLEGSGTWSYGAMKSGYACLR